MGFRKRLKNYLQCIYLEKEINEWDFIKQLKNYLQRKFLEKEINEWDFVKALTNYFQSKFLLYFWVFVLYLQKTMKYVVEEMLPKNSILI